MLLVQHQTLLLWLLAITMFMAFIIIPEHQILPGNVDPSTFVGQSISALIASGNCLLTSSNCKPMVITGCVQHWIPHQPNVTCYK